MVELRRDRRLMLGELVSLVFENRETVKAMIEALVCAEWVESPERIADELELFNVLVPSDGELRGTLFVAARDGDDMRLVRDMQDSLVRHVHLVFGDASAEAADELGETQLMPTVRYVRFHVDAAEQAALRARGTNVAVVVDHPQYSTRTELTASQCAALANDLADV